MATAIAVSKWITTAACAIRIWKPPAPPNCSTQSWRRSEPTEYVVKKTRNFLKFAVTIAALLPAAAVGQAQTQVADIVLTNGKIITVDDSFSIRQAVAVRGDRIIAV